MPGKEEGKNKRNQSTVELVLLMQIPNFYGNGEM